MRVVLSGAPFDTIRFELPEGGDQNAAAAFNIDEVQLTSCVLGVASAVDNALESCVADSVTYNNNASVYGNQTLSAGWLDTSYLSERVRVRP